jgi:uncharacterized membrane protein
MTASAWWIDGPILWLLAAILIFLFLIYCSEAREHRLAREEAQKPLAPVVQLKDHRHDR